MTIHVRNTVVGALTAFVFSNLDDGELPICVPDVEKTIEETLHLFIIAIAFSGG